MPNRTRSKGGRPTRFSATSALALVAGVRSGLPLHRAARAAGLGRSTAFRWVHLGRSGNPEYASLTAALDRARADHRAEVLEARRRETDIFVKLLERARPTEVFSAFNDLAAEGFWDRLPL